MVSAKYVGWDGPIQLQSVRKKTKLPRVAAMMVQNRINANIEKNSIVVNCEREYQRHRSGEDGE